MHGSFNALVFRPLFYTNALNLGEAGGIKHLTAARCALATSWIALPEGCAWRWWKCATVSYLLSRAKQMFRFRITKSQPTPQKTNKDVLTKGKQHVTVHMCISIIRSCNMLTWSDSMLWYIDVICWYNSLLRCIVMIRYTSIYGKGTRIAEKDWERLRESALRNYVTIRS